MNKRIRELRNNLGFTMEKFGKNLGVGKTAISKIEKGENTLTDQMITSICNVNWDGKYVNEEWLRNGTGEMFKKDSGDELKALAEKYKMSDMEYTFLREYFKLPQSQRKNFFQTLDTMFSNIHTNPYPAFDISATSESLENIKEELSDEEVLRRYHKGKEIEREVKEKSEAS